MEPVNPFAPPTAPLGHPTPPPARSPADPLWWGPAALAAFCFALLIFAIVTGIDQYRATGGHWDAGTPIVWRSAVVAAGAGVGCVAFGLTAQACRRHRWIRAFALLASFGVFMVLLALSVRGR